MTSLARPMATKAFQRQPPQRRSCAIARVGFSQNWTKLVRAQSWGHYGKARTGSIQPYEALSNRTLSSPHFNENVEAGLVLKTTEGPLAGLSAFHVRSVHDSSDDTLTMPITNGAALDGTA
jgi:hypothetical protein